MIVNGGGGGGTKMSANVKSSYGFLKAGLAGVPDLTKKVQTKVENEEKVESSHHTASPVPTKKTGVRRKQKELNKKAARKP